MTLVVNLVGGPGSGKSTMAAGLFYNLKKDRLDAELVVEYAKELTFEKRHDALLNQIDIFSTQRQRANRLIGNCDVIICDAPAFICGIYCTDLFPDSFRDLIAWDHHSHPNTINILVERVHEYSSHGRKQSEDQARALDDEMTSFLKKYDIEYGRYPGNDEGHDEVLTLIRSKLI